MSQKTSGIRAILSLPAIYKSFQKIFGKSDANEIILNEYIKPNHGDKILDIGCGPANWLNYMPSDATYIGVDLSKEYIEEAKKNFGDKGIFINKDVKDIDFEELGAPDVVILMGVMHHLEDSELLSLLKSIKKISKSSTRVITLDGCFTSTQGLIAKYLLKLDRGQNVRGINEYSEIVSEVFKSNYYIREDLTRLPYTFIVFECFND